MYRQNRSAKIPQGRLGRKVPVVLGAFPLWQIFYKDYDTVKTTETATRNEYQEETGTDRLKKMFSRDEDYNLSPELQNIIWLTSGTGLAGIIIGGIRETRFAVTDFIEQNQATKYAHRHQAQRAMQDIVVLKFVKGGIPYGSKMALFVSIYMTTYHMLGTYRGNSQLKDCGLAGGTAGFALKMYLGLRGALVGTLVGAVLGLVAGCGIHGLLALRGFIPEPRRDFVKEHEQLNAVRKKEKASKKNTEPTAKDLFEANELMKEHLNHNAQDVQLQQE